MDWTMILEAIWIFINSPAGVALSVAVAIWAMNRVYAARPDWRKHQGTIIAAIKYAEKTIPNDSYNKSVKRLDEALGYVIKVIEAAQSKPVTPAEIIELKEGIQVSHAELEAEGIIQ